MAKLIEAIRDYGPYTKLNSTVATPAVAELISLRTTLNENLISLVLQELKTGILLFNCQGTPVDISGMARFAPSIDRHGQYRINVRVSRTLGQAINNYGAYTGRVENRQHIGLDNAAYKALWDAAHPDNPLEI